MKIVFLVFAFIGLGCCCASAQSQICKIILEKTFAPDGTKVRLAQMSDLSSSAAFAIFYAPLAVNTDGAPNSYHPFDPRGESKAVNRFDNGIGVKKVDRKAFMPGEKQQAFEAWRDGGFNSVAGYKFSWKNVIAASDGKPCVFSSGEYRGYFGSLTALKNGLNGAAAGECQVKNQLDQRSIPAIVLRGGAGNPLIRFGARVGDLALAVNPANGAVVAAVIGDSGDGKRIGEGSIALNLALLGKTAQPATYADAKRLDTGPQKIIVAVLPRTKDYKLVQPYSSENIAQRARDWADAIGYGDAKRLVDAIRLCTAGL